MTAPIPLSADIDSSSATTGVLTIDVGMLIDGAGVDVGVIVVGLGIVTDESSCIKCNEDELVASHGYEIKY